MSSTGVRPVLYRDGTPVPFITAWSGEHMPSQPVAEVCRRGGTGLGFVDEQIHVDRQYGALWVRMPAVRTGQPELRAVHALRQRQAMSRLLCQMCGGPTVGIRDDERTLFLMGAAGGHPICEGERTSSPPVHPVCARLAVENCPRLRRGWAAALVSYTPVWGVQGVMYSPKTLEPEPDVSVSFMDARRLRWVLASRLLVTLEGVTAVNDLDALCEDSEFTEMV
ncbi:hypothetical protein [Streptomyces roseochromogenus]|uniref:Uncharacterized protein n=1 Tax=Streptomyces roseochromogenus subsp. oscitans DS 12.976 TaxID=1352936 RepID=V6JWV3_STRRC|nr:hypothetical protein [Streptomyces roseochromogenus]EST24410.1 hypothetical protein M878_30830 [Streptomyces roseochromogenus subsp. oscitans DS 12.976]